jgi:CRP-like cAMP-binding protein
MGNVILDSLPANEIDLIRPYLRTAALNKDSVLIEPGDASENLYFPRTGLISCIASTSIGEQMEIHAAGANDVIGLVDTDRQPWRAKVQIQGEAAMLSYKKLLCLLPRMEKLRHVLFDYLENLTVRIAQRVCCAKLHATSERVCLWLALAMAITNAAELDCTQQAMADLIGARRATVTVILGELEQERLIHCTRGRIHIVDKKGLENLSCDCFEVLRPGNSLRQVLSV